MSSNIKDIESLIAKVDKFKKDNKLDLSSSEDLSIGVMNLISTEEHLFFTCQKTNNKQYLDLLNEVRLMRTQLMKELIKDYKGEVWCISKHLLAASMRIMEVGTKELKKAVGAEPAEAERHKKKAQGLFDKSYKLYSLFWGINLGFKDTRFKIKPDTHEQINYLDEQGNSKAKESVFSKLGKLVQKAVDCCKE